MNAVPPVDVVVGVLLRAQGEALLTQRPPGKPYAGYWEFPGGKVESGESKWHALVRELREELGIEVLSGAPWCCVQYQYPHANVRLHFYLCHDWQGEPRGLEGQAWAWQREITLSPFLPATIPLLPDLDAVRFPSFAR